MELARLPFFDRLASSQSVLLAGAGGGSDVYCAVPLYFALRAQGKRVHLANLSFTELREHEVGRLGVNLVAVTADTEGSKQYFPERWLCQWLRSVGEESPIHALEKVGVVPLTAAYRALVAHLGCDAVVLVDGGTDSLMRGDEAGLGTPVEDIASIAAVHALDVPTKLLACIGFGIDAHHGVCHAHFLEAVSALARDGGYLGTFSLQQEMPEARRYLEAVAHAAAVQPIGPSIVNASIAAALEGHYGDHHSTARTAGSRLWINPLMAMYFTFDADAVARRVLYLRAIADTRTAFEIAAIIEAWREENPVRPREPIPV